MTTSMPVALDDGANFVTKAFVAGRWVANSSSLSVTDPTDGGTITTVAAASAQDVEDALAAAHHVERTWRHTPATERATLFSKVADALDARSAELAPVISSEVGKPLAESAAEVAVSASYFRWAAGQALRAAGKVLTPPSATTTLTTTVTPVGLVVAITPWNFPLAMVARKIATPLALGCPVIVKPSEQAPLSALLLAQIIQAAGLPDGVLSTLPMPPGDAATALIVDERVRYVSFTGSAPAGSTIHRLLGGHSGVGWNAELGGSAPVLVLSDADVRAAADLIAAAKFRNAGQTCVAPNRIIVDNSIRDRFVDHFVAAMNKIVVGSWREPASTMGPLKSEERAAAVGDQLNDAARKGATVLGGEPLNGSRATFLTPAAVLDWTSDMLVAQEETFGPIAPIRGADSPAEMVEIANHPRYGLAAYVFGTDVRTVTHTVDALDYGVVGVNQLANAFANAPIGGWNGSGIGVEGGTEGTEQYLRPKLIAMDIGPQLS
jgi:succinate-semialdehyde dehydrogenase / glutarate-semialdehyde dehydrogenase